MSEPQLKEVLERIAGMSRPARIPADTWSRQ